MQASLPKAIIPQGGSHDPELIGLSDELVANLENILGVSKLFTTQAAVAGYILRLDSVEAPGDVLVSSPTGSGKTLAYVIPIVSALKERFIRRLRCIVIAPSRDLAMQIKKVFEALATGTTLSIVVASGVSSIEAEKELIGSADVLISTPGRLVDHVKSTSTLTLQHVKYLVLDEADRLLHESYYGWLDIIVPLCGKPLDASMPCIRNPRDCCGFAAYPMMFASECIRPRKILLSATLSIDVKKHAKLDLALPKRFISASAEKSFDNTKSGRNMERIQVSPLLEENIYTVESPSHKLLVLLKLLGWLMPSDSERSSTRTVKPLKTNGVKLIFTKSVASGHRLRRLLEIYALLQSDVLPNAEVLEISGNLPSSYRTSAVESLRRAASELERDIGGSNAQTAAIGVCSDVFARGMDVVGADNVINYDVPNNAKSYVHRSGRTARAGRAGSITSIAVTKEAHHFKLLLNAIDRGSRTVNFQRTDGEAQDFAAFLPGLAKATNVLRKVITRERLGLVTPHDSLPEHVVESVIIDEFSHTNGAAIEVADGNPGSHQHELGHVIRERDDDVYEDDEQYAADPIVANENDSSETFHHNVGLAEGHQDANHDEGTEMVVEDESFQDLLRAQLMRNYLT